MYIIQLLALALHVILAGKGAIKNLGTFPRKPIGFRIILMSPSIYQYVSVTLSFNTA